MLTEDEVKAWRENEKQKSVCLVDPIEQMVSKIAIATLDGVINE